MQYEGKVQVTPFLDGATEFDGEPLDDVQLNLTNDTGVALAKKIMAKVTKGKDFEFSITLKGLVYDEPSGDPQEPKYGRYQVATADDLDELEVLINEIMIDGFWYPHGSLLIDKTQDDYGDIVRVFCQPMVWRAR